MVQRWSISRGSKPHNIKLRNLGEKLDYKINEYGVFKQDKQIAGKTEAEIEIYGTAMIFSGKITVYVYLA